MPEHNWEGPHAPKKRKNQMQFMLTNLMLPTPDDFRFSENGKHKHEEHIADQGYNSLSLDSSVHLPIPIPKVAVDKECNEFQKSANLARIPSQEQKRCIRGASKSGTSLLHSKSLCCLTRVRLFRFVGFVCVPVAILATCVLVFCGCCRIHVQSWAAMVSKRKRGRPGFQDRCARKKCWLKPSQLTGERSGFASSVRRPMSGRGGDAGDAKHPSRTAGWRVGIQWCISGISACSGAELRCGSSFLLSVVGGGTAMFFSSVSLSSEYVVFFFSNGLP